MNPHILISLVSVPWQQKQLPEGLAVSVFSEVHVASVHFCHACYAYIINENVLKYNLLSEQNPQLRVQFVSALGEERGNGLCYPTKTHTL